MLSNVLKCQVNLKEQCFLFIKIAINLRSGYNELRTVYNLPMSVRLVNARSYQAIVFKYAGAMITVTF